MPPARPLQKISVAEWLRIEEKICQRTFRCRHVQGFYCLSVPRGGDFVRVAMSEGDDVRDWLKLSLHPSVRPSVRRAGYHMSSLLPREAPSSH